MELKLSINYNPKCVHEPSIIEVHSGVKSQIPIKNLLSEKWPFWNGFLEFSLQCLVAFCIQYSIVGCLHEDCATGLTMIEIWRWSIYWWNFGASLNTFIWFLNFLLKVQKNPKASKKFVWFRTISTKGT